MSDSLSRELLTERGFWVDDWFVDPQLNRVAREDETVQLEPKVMEVLLCLAEQPGTAVTKEEFMEEVWTDTVVTDDVLSRCISELRKTFGDKARDPEYIETIRKTGYRLIAPVALPKEAPSAEPSSAPADLSPESVSYGTLLALLRQKLVREITTSRTRMWSAGGLIVALLSGLIVGVVWLGSESSSTEQRSAFLPAPFTTLPGVESDPALSPDGKQVAFAWDRGSSKDSDIYLKQTGAETPLRLTATRAHEHSPAWSPDGRALAFVRSEKDAHRIFTIPSIGGSEQKVADFGARAVRSLTWAPDGSALVASAQHAPHATFSLYLIDLDEAEQRRLTTPPTFYQGDFQPTFSPDGTRLAFVRSASTELEDVFVLSLDGEDEVLPTRLTSDSTSVTGLDWMPGGERLIFASNREGQSGLWTIDAGGGSPQWIVAAGEGSSFFDLSMARSAPLLTYTKRTSDTNIWRVWREQAFTSYRSQPLLFSTRWDSHPQVAPDGERIAFASRRSGHPEIWVSDRDGSNLVQLTSFEGPFTGMPRWSPDGTYLSFVSRRAGHADVYAIDAEGGSPRRLTTLPSDEEAPAWTVDGDGLYMASNWSGEWQLWQMNLSRGTMHPLTLRGGRTAAAGPHGRWLYYVKPDTPGIWRRPLLQLPSLPLVNLPLPDRSFPAFTLPEQQVVASLDPADWGNWSVTEEGIYFVRRDERTPMLAFYAFADGSVEPVTGLQSVPNHPALSAAPEGDMFLYTQLDRTEGDLFMVDSLR